MFFLYTVSHVHGITKTCLYIFDPLQPHFHIIKLGFTGVYFIFLISAQNIECGYSLEPPRRGGSNDYPQSIFEQKYEKYQFLLSENLQLWRWTFLYIYLNRRVFVMNSFSFFDCFVDQLAYSKFVLNVLLTIHLYNEILVAGSGGQSIACKYLLHCHYRWCCLNLCSRDCFVHGSWTFLPPLCCLLGAEVWSFDVYIHL